MANPVPATAHASRDEIEKRMSGKDDQRGQRAASPADPVISIENVTHSFVANKRGGDPVKVVDDVSLGIQEGELVAVIGPSGCGKSTLLNMIAGLITPDVGTVRVRGQIVDGIDKRRKIGYMFARDGLLPWRTTLRNVAFGLELTMGQKAAAARAKELLEEVGLSGFEDAYRSQLSQGMRQRAALARTLSIEPTVLLLDEPFGALDAQTKVLIEERFMAIRERLGITTVFVTHDLMEAILLADRIVVMSARPTRVKAVVPLNRSRARSATASRFDEETGELYERLWEELRPEAVLGEMGGGVQ